MKLAEGTSDHWNIFAFG